MFFGAHENPPQLVRKGIALNESVHGCPVGRRHRQLERSAAGHLCASQPEAQRHLVHESLPGRGELLVFVALVRTRLKPPELTPT